MAVYKSVSELIGNTPLVELSNYEKNHNLNATIIGKVELFNPAGSIKDRIAKGEPGTGDVIQAVRHMRKMNQQIRHVVSLREDELFERTKRGKLRYVVSDIK